MVALDVMMLVLEEGRIIMNGLDRTLRLDERGIVVHHMLSHAHHLKQVRGSVTAKYLKNKNKVKPSP